MCFSGTVITFSLTVTLCMLTVFDRAPSLWPSLQYNILLLSHWWHVFDLSTIYHHTCFYIEILAVRLSVVSQSPLVHVLDSVWVMTAQWKPEMPEHKVISCNKVLSSWIIFHHFCISYYYFVDRNSEDFLSPEILVWWQKVETENHSLKKNTVSVKCVTSREGLGIVIEKHIKSKWSRIMGLQVHGQKWTCITFSYFIKFDFFLMTVLFFSANTTFFKTSVSMPVYLFSV